MATTALSEGSGAGSTGEIADLIRQLRGTQVFPATLGRRDVLVETMQGGRGAVTCVYEIRADRVTVLRAIEDSYREDVAIALLDAVDELADPGELGPVARIRPMQVEGFGLDRAAVLGPGGHQEFREAPSLARRTVGVVPVQHSEVVDGEDQAAFWFAMSNKGLGLSAYQWNRDPRPRADIRLLDDWPGGPLRRSRRLTSRRAERLIREEVPNLARGVRMLVRDVRGYELILRRQWDRLVGTATAPHDTTAVEVDLARLAAWDALAPLFQGEDVDLTALSTATSGEPTEADMLELTYSTQDRGYASLPVLRPLDECVARLSTQIVRSVGNVAVFESRSGVIVQVRVEDGQRLWLETPDPTLGRSRGRHVTLDEAARMLEILAGADRSAVDELGDLRTRDWS
jgi:hypothetical protein